MKKVILTILSIMELGFAFSQDPVTQLTDPPVARGYVSWMPVSGATQYRIEFFDASDTRTVITEFNTTGLYYKADPMLFHVPNMGYRIVALNNDGGVVATSDPVLYPPNPTEYETVCERECNGISYAYRLRNIQEQDNPGAPHRITTDNAYEFYDEAQGLAIPFFQAIKQNVWDVIPFIHPYKSGNYETIYLPANHAGTYKDAEYNVVLSGMLVEKKFDQYDPFIGITTVEGADAGSNICNASMSIAGQNVWLDFFNNYREPGSPPQSNPFNGDTITQLECIGAWEEDPEPGEPSEGEDLNEWFEELLWDFITSQNDLNTSNGGHPITWEGVISSFADVAGSSSGNGHFITNLLFKNLVNEEKTGNLYRTSHAEDFLVDRSSTDLPNGLYLVSGLTDNGKVFIFYMDISSSVQTPSMKDRSALVIYPNPITDNNLNFGLTGIEGASGVYYVHDLMGNPLLNDVFTIGSSGLTVKEDLSPYEITTDFIILSVIFEDGSVLQEIVQIVQG